ncbi:MAG: alpha/beta hydrolase [Bacteroidetes bacterium]|nr:alpha/beta hydrolase [Bacteroidota bacterium]MBS1539862.1 alpha/beta hydrolase [Bacteroidota bacterium]
MPEIKYDTSNLQYYKNGNGAKTILLFHGFGQDHHAFDTWIERMKGEYTLYGFDLFFHGASDWHGSRPVEKEDWKNILEIFFQQESIHEFEMAGFSLGGKFVLATLEAFPQRVKKIWLLAPDGIKINFWYRLATYPLLTRALFHSFIFRPKIFFALIHFFDRFGLASKYLLRFALSQMDTEEKRKRVYHSWIYFRHLRFDMREVAAHINSHHIPLTVCVGKHDKVIPAKDMHRLLKFVPHGKFEVPDTGHNQLIEKVFPYFDRK